MVPHLAPRELSSRHKPGSLGVSFGAILGAVLGVRHDQADADNSTPTLYDSLALGSSKH